MFVRFPLATEGAMCQRLREQINYDPVCVAPFRARLAQDPGGGNDSAVAKTFSACVGRATTKRAMAAASNRVP